MATYIHGNKPTKRLLYIFVLSVILTLLVVCIFPFWGRVSDGYALYSEWKLYMNKSSDMLRAGMVDEAVKPSESALRVAYLLKSKARVGASTLQLAGVFSLRGDYSEAVSRYREALDIVDSFPEKAKLAVSTRELLAKAYVKQGKLSEAEKYACEAVNKSKVVDESCMISSLETLAYVRESQRRFKEAESLYNTVLAMSRAKKRSTDEPACLIMLGYLHCHMGKYDKARSEINEALKIARQRLGPYHRYTAEALYALSYISFKEGQLDKAGTLCAKAIQIARKTLGPRDVTTLSYVLHSARIEAARCNYVSAKGSLEKLIATYEQFYGPDNKRMVTALEDYESTLQKMGLSGQARAAHSRAQKIRHELAKERSR